MIHQSNEPRHRRTCGPDSKGLQQHAAAPTQAWDRRGGAAIKAHVQQRRLAGLARAIGRTADGRRRPTRVATVATSVTFLGVGTTHLFATPQRQMQRMKAHLSRRTLMNLWQGREGILARKEAPGEVVRLRHHAMNGHGRGLFVVIEANVGDRRRCHRHGQRRQRRRSERRSSDVDGGGVLAPIEPKGGAQDDAETDQTDHDCAGACADRVVQRCSPSSRQPRRTARRQDRTPPPLWVAPSPSATRAPRRQGQASYTPRSGSAQEKGACAGAGRRTHRRRRPGARSQTATAGRRRSVRRPRSR